MTSPLLLVFLAAGGSLLPGPSDLLQTTSVAEWAALPLGESPRTLLDGLPVSDAGLDRLPPWGMVRSAELRSPIEGGLWSGGRWSLEFSGYGIPDSSYQTRVGLLQNTFDRHRYSGSLRRPLPWGLGMNVTAGREDSLRMERIRLVWRGLAADGIAWREDTDAYSAWIGGSPLAGTFGRLSLSSPREGQRWAGGLVQVGLDREGARLELGAAAAGCGDSSRLEVHTLGRLPLGRFTLVSRGDLEGPADSPDPGLAGGVVVGLGPVVLSAGAVSAPGDGLEGVLSATAGPAAASIAFDDSCASAGAGLGMEWGLSRVDLAAAADTEDSLEARLRLMPGISIVNARLRAGGVLRARGLAGGDWELQGDAMAEYTLSTFSMVVALEDLDDLYNGGTSFTYGVLWSFTDLVKRPEREGEEGS